MNTTSAITPTIETTMNMSENTEQQHLVKENVEIKGFPGTRK
jgi:hypothetical protein